MDTKIETLLRKIVLADNIDDVRAEALDLLIENARSGEVVSHRVIRTQENIYENNFLIRTEPRSVSISHEDYNDIQGDILNHNKIPAIKKLRTLTNPIWGLKATKDAVEDSNNFRQS